MLFIERLAEQRIQEAIQDGQLDNLALAGQPLELHDDSAVPRELRAGYRLLKNAGYLPPELETRREIKELNDLLRVVDDPQEQRRACARLNYLLAKLGAGNRKGTNLRVDDAYYHKLVARMARDGDPD